MTYRESKNGRRSALPEDGSAPREFLRLLARKVIQRLKNRAPTGRKQNNRVSHARDRDTCKEAPDFSGKTRNDLVPDAVDCKTRASDLDSC